MLQLFLLQKNLLNICKATKLTIFVDSKKIKLKIFKTVKTKGRGYDCACQEWKLTEFPIIRRAKLFWLLLTEFRQNLDKIYFILNTVPNPRKDIVKLCFSETVILHILLLFATKHFLKFTFSQFFDDISGISDHRTYPFKFYLLFINVNNEFVAKICFIVPKKARDFFDSKIRLGTILSKIGTSIKIDGNTVILSKQVYYRNTPAYVVLMGFSISKFMIIFLLFQKCILFFYFKRYGNY